jgi:hypothetical protein
MHQRIALTVAVLLSIASFAHAQDGHAVREKLKKAAEAPQFKAAVAKMAELTGQKPQPLQTEAEGDDTGGVIFSVSHEKAEDLLAVQRQLLRAKGAYLFRYQNMKGIKIGNDAMPDVVALLPTKDKYEVLAAVETEGPNSKVYNKDLIAWLKELEKTQPIDIAEAGTDFCAGTFKKKVADPKAIAEKVAKLCPDLLDTSTMEQLTDSIAKGKLYLWWD